MAAASSGPMVCSKCTEIIAERHDYIVCDGVCGRSIHLDCTQLTKSAVKATKDFENVLFSCDECITNSIKTVNNKVDGIYAILDRLEKRIESIGKTTKAIEKGTAVSEQRGGSKSNPNEKQTSFADVVKKRIKKVVLVRPKDTSKYSDSKQLKEQIKTNIDPTKINVCAMSNIAHGGVAIECNSDEAVEAVKKIATEKMGADFNIEEAKQRKSRIKIVGMNENHSNEDICEMLKKQNEYLADDSDINVIRTYEVNKKYYSAIIEMNKNSYDQCISDGSVRIKWDKCKVFEELPLIVCMKCCGYNHLAKECKQKEIVCRKCGSNHKLIDCKSDDTKCVNCDIANKKNGFNFNIKHKSNDPICEVRKQKLEWVRRKMQLLE